MNLTISDIQALLYAWDNFCNDELAFVETSNEAETIREKLLFMINSLKMLESVDIDKAQLSLPFPSQC